MFKSKTVFIIGAGASREIGLPLGKELAQRIADKMALNADGFHVTGGDGPLFSQIAPPANLTEYAYAGLAVVREWSLARSGRERQFGDESRALR